MPHLAPSVLWFCANEFSFYLQFTNYVVVVLCISIPTFCPKMGSSCSAGQVSQLTLKLSIRVKNKGDLSDCEGWRLRLE